MQNFTRDISKTKLPVCEKVSGKAVRNGVLKEIQKEFPILMMRYRAKNDYMVNLKSELEIRMLHEKIDHLLITQEENLLEIQKTQKWT